MMGPRETKDFRWFAMRVMLDNLPQFAAERVQMTLSSSGASHRAILYLNQLPDFEGTWRRYFSPSLYGLRQRPPSPKLFMLQRRLVTAVTSPHGFWSYQTLVWDLYIPLSLLLIVPIVRGIYGPETFFIAVSLALAAELFLVIPDCEFRYFYSIFMSAFFTIPLCLVAAVKRSG
jgi:hypothetical protein